MNSKIKAERRLPQVNDGGRFYLHEFFTVRQKILLGTASREKPFRHICRTAGHNGESVNGLNDFILVTAQYALNKFIEGVIANFLEFIEHSLTVRAQCPLVPALARIRMNRIELIA